MKWIFFEENITGETPDEIVASLKSGSKFAGEQTTKEFIKGVAERIAEFNGFVIRSDTTDNFVSDIILTGLLHPVN